MRRCATLLLSVVVWWALVVAPAPAQKPGAVSASYRERVLDVDRALEKFLDHLEASVEGNPTDAQLDQRLRSVARRLHRIERRLGRIAPAPGFAPAQRRLQRTLPPVRRDLLRLARAARRHDEQAAARLERPLDRHMRALASAWRQLVGLLR